MGKKLWEWVVFRFRLMEMDSMWYLWGGNCFGVFPPSFYYTHSEREIKKIQDELFRELEEYLRSYRARIMEGRE